MKLHKILLGLGANIGDRETNIKKAINLLSIKISNIKLAKIYESKPVGYTKQNNFLNTALVGLTALSPEELIKFVKEVEKGIGRIKRFKWGPREIDIDILFYDNLSYKSIRVEIPHPRLHERDFVLKPLMDLDPDFIHPIFRRKIFQLYAELPRENLAIIHAYSQQSPS